MYRMDILLSLILVVSEMLKIPRSKGEAHFLKRLAFVTNKYLAQDTVETFPRTTETLKNSSARIVMCTNFLIISYILQSYPSK